MNYKKETSESGYDFIVRDNGDGTTSWIPVDLSNSDYQHYLNLEAKQSTPNLAGLFNE
jgi:hypothetical protein